MQTDIEKVITSQLKTNALKSLFFDENFVQGAKFCFCCSEYTAKAMQDDRGGVLGFIETLEQEGLIGSFAEHMSDVVVKTLEDINQFIVFGKAGRAAVRRVYAEFVGSVKALCMDDDIDEERITQMFLNHYANLRNALVTTNGTKLFEEYALSPIVGRKVCSEYTPQFQIEVLGIDIAQISEPVLDLRCGKCGGLVKYLNEHGVDAYGADRNAEQHPRLFKKDWFDFELKAETWGTVISHMALSNHIRHAMKHAKDDLYVRKYYEILHSLKTGGKFVYAPGLIEIEDGLPASFSIERKAVCAGRGFYCANITKLK